MKERVAVSAGQLTVTLTALGSDCKWQAGQMLLRSWLNGTESHIRAIFTVSSSVTLP